MRRTKLLASVILGGLSSSALACEVPPLPVFPEDERIRGRVERELKEEMVRYVTDMSVYVACVRAEYADAERNEAPDTHLALLAVRNNDAIAELEAVRDIFVARVGPIEELFFEHGFDPGDRVGGATRMLAPVPMGPDSVLRRTEIILGDSQCAEISTCSKDVTSGGVERRLRPITGPSSVTPGQ